MPVPDEFVLAYDYGRCEICEGAIFQIRISFMSLWITKSLVQSMKNAGMQSARIAGSVQGRTKTMRDISQKKSLP